jgi:hypothetical protein
MNWNEHDALRTTLTGAEPSSRPLEFTTLRGNGIG